MTTTALIVSLLLGTTTLPAGICEKTSAGLGGGVAAGQKVTAAEWVALCTAFQEVQAALILPTPVVSLTDSTVTITGTGTIHYSTTGTATTSSPIYSAPFTLSSGTTTVTAISVLSGRLESAVASETFTVPGPASTEPYFGTAASPGNRPIADWAVEICVRNSLGTYNPSTGNCTAGSIFDPVADTNLQNALRYSGTWDNNPYFSFGSDTYNIVVVDSGNVGTITEYPMANASGVTWTCSLDSGKGWTGVRIPSAAHLYGQADLTMHTPTDDEHFTVVDTLRNRIYAFYASSSGSLGVTGGVFRSSYRGCDLNKATGTDGGGDAALLALQTVTARYSCSAGWCDLAGLGAGAPIGSGDSNGYLGPHGVIMPQDFDDTGWTGTAVGTLHHAIRVQFPVTWSGSGYSGGQSGGMWPIPDSTYGGSYSIKNGSIFILDPALDIVALTGGSSPTNAQLAQRRILKTMQVYGLIQSDGGNYGPELFALLNTVGTGIVHNSYAPWTSSGGANAEAVAFGDGYSSTRFDFLPSLSWPTYLHVLRAHGATY